ncbi:hypothetical protein [Paraburkholderia youngii]|uniref:hypothetical protein n=1 Tax=Paraburkholderia youngii TaxID=2782701 RepID=UPI003D248E93
MQLNIVNLGGRAVSVVVDGDSENGVVLHPGEDGDFESAADDAAIDVREHAGDGAGDDDASLELLHHEARQFGESLTREA